MTMMFPIRITLNATYFPIGTILRVAAMLIALVAVMVLYTILVSHLIPKLTLRPRYVARLGDRGISRYRTEDGYAVVYAPGTNCAAGITQYVLLHGGEDGVKSIVCKTDGTVDRIQYDVAVFDAVGQLIDVLSVTDVVSKHRYTKAIALPQDTSYVSVIPRQVNGKNVCEDRVFDSDRTGRIVCVASTVLLTILLSVVMRWLLTAAVERLNDVYRFSRAITPHTSWSKTLLVAGILGLIPAGLQLLQDKRHTKRKMNR